MDKRFLFPWVFITIFYVFQYVLRVLPNLLLEDLIGRFGISPTVIGQFSGLYYIGYSCAHLPLGLLLDRVGPRYVLPACALLTGVGLIPLVVPLGSVSLLLGRFCIGVGSSAAILGVFKILHLSVQAEKFPRYLSLSVAAGLMGAVYGTGPLQYMLSSLGYETVLWSLIAVSAGVSFFIYIYSPHIEKKPAETVSQSLVTILANPRFLVLCLSAGLMVGPLEGFADVWGVEFLKISYRFSKQEASLSMTFVFMGMALGGPFLSHLMEKTHAPLKIILVAAIVMGLCMIALLLKAPFPKIILFIMGIFCSYQIIAIYQASSYCSPQLSGLSTALANMIIMSFGYGFHSLIGFSIDKTQSIAAGLSLIPIGLIVSVSLIYRHSAKRG